MRELLFRNLTSIESRKKDIFLKEAFEKDGLLTKIERRCFYFIKEIRHLDNEEELQKWIDSKPDLTDRDKRHFHIFKEHNDSHGEDKIVCKIAGIFYAVVDRNVYTIAFLHSFKVDVLKVLMHS